MFPDGVAPLKRLFAVALPILMLLVIWIGLTRTASNDADGGLDPERPGAGNGATFPDARSGVGDSTGESASASDPAGSADAAPLVLALEGEGLRLFDAETGSARPIPFGTAAGALRSMLVTALDGVALDEGENAECNARTLEAENGLTMWIVDDSFAGWAVRSPAPGLTTASGIGIGSSRADLESVYDARIFQSSLGVEFSAGALAGLLESDDPEAEIVHLWAGQTCIAR